MADVKEHLKMVEFLLELSKGKKFYVECYPTDLGAIKRPNSNWAVKEIELPVFDKLASPCALCEGKEKEIAELKEQYGIMKGRTERAIKSLEESEKQFGELQEAYNKLINQ